MYLIICISFVMSEFEYLLYMLLTRRSPSRPAAAGASVPPAGCAPGAAVPRGASPRPAPSSRLRTGADQGNPTV